MLMPKKDRMAIYEYLFTEGVLVAEKNFDLIQHPKIKVSNLYVIKALQSLHSRGYVTERFAWRHYYWYLTNEGIQYLRDVLHLPAEIVPSTLKKQTKPDAGRAKKSEAPKPAEAAGDASRGEYRRGPATGQDKKADVGAGSLEFVSHFILLSIKIPTKDSLF